MDKELPACLRPIKVRLTEGQASSIRHALGQNKNADPHLWRMEWWWRRNNLDKHTERAVRNVITSTDGQDYDTRMKKGIDK